MGELQQLAQDLQLDFDHETYSLSRISVRMSDRAATEGRVTKLLLEEKERMSEGAADWETLSEGEKQERKAVRSFTCASHKINNTASAMTTASSKHLYGDAAGGRQLTGAQKLIYEVNKLICARGRKEYCDGMDFKLYCLVTEEISYEGSAAHLMQPIVGNRYIVFLVGPFSNPSQHNIAAVSLIGSATNDCVESCFGVLDREQCNCPIRNPLNTSSIVTAKKDKPVQFVADLPGPEKDKVVSLARKCCTFEERARNNHGSADSAVPESRRGQRRRD